MSRLIMLSAVILLTIGAAFRKKYTEKNGDSVYGALHFNLLYAVIGFVVFFAINGFSLDMNAKSVALAAAQGIFSLAYFVLSFKIMEESGITLYTFFLMTGGMILPFVWGVVFLDERLTYLRVFGLVLIFASLALSNIKNVKVNFKVIAECIAVFILNGFVSITSKIHQIMPGAVSEIDFILWANIVKIILSALPLMVMRVKGKTTKIQLNIMAFVLILLAALADGFSYMLQLIGASSIPATELYPIITGGTVVFTAICGAVAFGERLEKRVIIGIVVCVIGTCMFL